MSGRAVRIAAFVAVAVAAHLLAVWAVPRAIMQRVISGVVAEAGDGVLRPPPVDAGARRVVLPNPDLLYALCAYDVSAAPLRVRAEPGVPGYWSIALYASDTDTWFVLNDRGAAGRPVDLVVARAGASPGALPGGATRVDSPSARGLLLMRVHLEGGAAQREAAEAARRSLRCEPIQGAAGRRPASREGPARTGPPQGGPARALAFSRRASAARSAGTSPASSRRRSRS